MNFGRLGLAVCLTGATLSAGCGTPGIPEPPSLELARPVRDLKATRKGNAVHLTWSVPELTEDHQTFRHAGPTRVCRSLGSPLRECRTPVAQLRPQKAPVQQNSRFKRKENSQKVTPPEESYTDQLSSSLELQSPTSNVVYAVSVLNSYGRSAGLSNQVEVPSAPTLPPPQHRNAQVSTEGVKLVWSAVTPFSQIPGLQYEYRVYRRDVGSNHDAIAGEVPVNDPANPSFLDTGFEWEKTYDYRVTVVTVVDRSEGPEQVEGEDTPPIRVVAHDIFPPAAPAGLQAVFSGPGQKPFIDLVWAGNSETDLAGYNVYRHEASGEPVKINTEVVKTPAFRDSGVLPGQKYFYSISAVDARGNESPRSEEASEMVPQAQ